jgi:hypothetical protein
LISDIFEVVEGDQGRVLIWNPYHEMKNKNKNNKIKISLMRKGEKLEKLYP